MENTPGAEDGGLRMMWVPSGESGVRRNEGCAGSCRSLVWRREDDLCRVNDSGTGRRGNTRRSVVRLFIVYVEGGGDGGWRR